MSTAELLKAVQKMSVKERIGLVDRIWETIDGDINEGPVELAPALKRELQRRLEDVEVHPEAESPWEEVRKRVLARLNGLKSRSAHPRNATSKKQRPGTKSALGRRMRR